MKRVTLALALLLAALLIPEAALAYSYSAAGAEPLLDGREALLGAVNKGDWSAAEKALQSMQSDIAYLDQNDDPGVAKAFSEAVAAKNPQRVGQALLRASADEIVRRLKGARDNISNYQTAKILVVKAQRFFTAVSGDLPPARRPLVENGLRRALDAIGNPGVFGVGAHPADPTAFDAARQDVAKALAGLGRSS